MEVSADLQVHHCPLVWDLCVILQSGQVPGIQVFCEHHMDGNQEDALGINVILDALSISSSRTPKQVHHSTWGD